VIGTRRRTSTTFRGPPAGRLPQRARSGSDLVGKVPAALPDQCRDRLEADGSESEAGPGPGYGREPDAPSNAAPHPRKSGVQPDNAVMMGEQDVVDVLGLLADRGLTAWVDGGWGVDALLGVTTREHDDLDLVVRLDEIDNVRAALDRAGFTTVLRDWLPTALAVADHTGRSVDLHPVTRSPDGGGDQALVDGGTFHYPAPVRGLIGGEVVSCVDSATQMVCHTGYEPTEKDRQDMANLRQRFSN
jgi:lincosamide nucleotidyltransferase A/C/D/E